MYNAAFSRKIKILIRSFIPEQIEDPCSNLQGIFDRKEVGHFQIRSPTPQQSAGNALAFAVQGACLSFTARGQMKAITGW